MTNAANKITLPELSLTEVAVGPGENVTQVDIPDENGETFTYYTRPLGDVDPTTGRRRDNKPTWSPHTFPLFPVVRNADGSPWLEANLWIIDRLVGKLAPGMLSYATVAQDLAAYRRYVDERNIDWLNFPPFKPHRPTYRYNGFLRQSVEAGEIAHNTARRRMGTLIRFYRWLKTAALFNPSHPAWVEEDRFVEVKDARGFSGVLKVTTTDVSIKGRTAVDPYSEYIDDGGKLRPLPQAEQKVLVQALLDLDNTEMTLIFLVSLFSGARIQTVLTVKVRHVIERPVDISGNDFRLPCGPGTGVDTKGSVRGVLHLPKWLYEALYVYAHSQRAQSRRKKAVGGDNTDQHLFLSNRGAPMYASRLKLDESGRGPHVARHTKNGQLVRQFIADYLLPAMRLRMNNPRYEFQFHDLRATFGLNKVDAWKDKINDKSMTYTEALSQLSQLMWHSSPTITERYLKYREKLSLFAGAQDGWNEHLMSLVLRTLDSEVRVASED
ncbi:site-specific integrase (plasmid) [Paraburkholderia graminis]